MPITQKLTYANWYFALELRISALHMYYRHLVDGEHSLPSFMNQLKEERTGHGRNISFSPDIYFLYTTITSLETSPLIGYKYRQQNTPLNFSLLYDNPSCTYVIYCVLFDCNATTCVLPLRHEVFWQTANSLRYDWMYKDILKVTALEVQHYEGKEQHGSCSYVMITILSNV
jgi:hypothetical protein